VRALRVLAYPAVALPLWAIDLAVWHTPALYDAAEARPWLHALEHACFFGAGLAMWAPVVETLPAPAWFGAAARLAYVLAVRVAMMALGSVFLFAGPLYYGSAADQRAAGGVMMLEGTTVTLAAFGWFFLRLLREAERRERLLERGASPQRAARAARFARDA
jgi:cytochrome c oxidase assembly factor CtaG